MTFPINYNGRLFLNCNLNFIESTENWIIRVLEKFYSFIILVFIWYILIKVYKLHCKNVYILNKNYFIYLYHLKIIDLDESSLEFQLKILCNSSFLCGIVVLI